MKRLVLGYPHFLGFSLYSQNHSCQHGSVAHSKVQFNVAGGDLLALIANLWPVQKLPVARHELHV